LREKILEKNTTATDYRQKLVNKIMLRNSIFVWNLDGPHQTIGTVFHCTVPKDFILSDFERILEGHQPFNVLWLDDTSAFVVFKGQVDVAGVVGCLDKQGLSPKISAEK